jgi:hypothetical protein
MCCGLFVKGLFPIHPTLKKLYKSISLCRYQVKSRAQKADVQKADINNPIKQKAEMQKADMSKSRYVKKPTIKTPICQKADILLIFFP